MKTRGVTLALVVLLALILSVHVPAQLISIPVVGETTGKAIEGNPQMVITGTPENGEPFEYDTIPTIPEPMGIRMDVALYNSAVRPEADATLGVAIGIGGWLSYEEFRDRTAAEKPYEEKTLKDLRRAQLGSVSAPGRWITAVRTGRVGFEKQRRGQNGPLFFTAFIEPEDLQPGINTFIVRVHGLLEERTTRFLILGKDGKSIFGTYDEPWLVKVGEERFLDETETPMAGPAIGDYITTQELRLVLDDLEKFKEEIRAMLGTSAPAQRPARTEDQGGGGLHIIWNDEDISQQPTAPRADTTLTMPDGIGISFDLDDGTAIAKSQTVNAVFDRGLPAGAHLWFAIYANVQWWPWKEVATSYVKNNKAGFSFKSDRIKPGPCALTVAVRDGDGN
ncbi:hypothetical protein KJ713_02840, partial [Patescibacteria group bacterium]|nr:hypothetical protein [Patescibacteria group bacterium]